MCSTLIAHFDRLVLSHCKFYSLLVLVLTLQTATSIYDEPHRPQLHYSPPDNWMNDPNGLVYHNGIYHLFFQYHPHGTIFGAMHWGHAVSTDLLHWFHLPIALFPDELGVIFSGCALVDQNNVTGLGTNKKHETLIALFTQHLETGGTQIEQQSLAYSTDMGINWKMFDKNPVIKNTVQPDFRDPKVLPFRDHYIMSVAAKDRIIFYRSKDLINWDKLSEFGATEGSHDGVWECPDLFPLEIMGKQIWVLLVSINPGGPNGGSATQYFVGHFDGEVFTNRNDPETVLWLDFGPDSYAGITWFGAPNSQRIFISWMSNWDYGVQVPTLRWKGQMSVPRTLGLRTVDEDILVTSTPIRMPLLLPYDAIKTHRNLLFEEGTTTFLHKTLPSSLLSINVAFDISHIGEKGIVELCFGNDFNESLCVGFDNHQDLYYIDRSKSGKVEFSQNFTTFAVAPRFVEDTLMYWQLIMDVSSVEFFGDKGLSVLTSLFFPSQTYNRVQIRVASGNSRKKTVVIVKYASIEPLRSIWNTKDQGRELDKMFHLNE